MAMGSPASPRNVGAVQPPRAARLLHTRRTLSKPASSSYRRFLVLCSFLRHPRRAASSPRYHFVCLSRGGPSRRVASSCALPYSRTLFSHPRVRAYIDRMLGSSFFLSLSLSLSLAYHSLPRCMPRACILLVARISDVARDDRIRRITTCVFYEPRRTALAKTNVRGFPGLF